MKKYLIPIICVSFILSYAAISLAGTTTLNGTTSAITNTNGTMGGPSLTYNVSPSVEMSVTTSASDYAITSANTKTGTDNGMEYGVLATTTGYAQRQKTTAKDSGPAATSSATALPGSSWHWMGGGTS